MLDKKSIYSLNKADSDTIVYIDAEGHTIRLTRQDFATAEEFEKWKAWSDENFHTEEKRAHVYRDHTLRLSGLSEAALSPIPSSRKKRVSGNTDSSRNNSGSLSYWRSEHG